ncbi:hypothetical protein Mcup_1045 [Metallosphaera cuprina Ar-4]|uniref:Uncharacterized protein n=1 Tax=Metallosphaera cuprina (strain Ar-4) TaxID=1006006 RepID=F4G2V2_METCR|nr:hypothetical protein Mcup_1045 [Metallosphaera cuprina Ar-4]
MRPAHSLSVLKNGRANIRKLGHEVVRSDSLTLLFKKANIIIMKSRLESFMGLKVTIL